LTERQTRKQAVSAEEAVGVLLETVRQLVAESHVHSGANTFATLDDSLERDLGFDSLGRVELVSRLERVFGINLPERTLANAETLRDLLKAVLTAAPAAATLKGMQRSEVPVRVHAEPSDALTLTEVLDWHVHAHPHRTHITLLDEANDEGKISYAALRKDAGEIASGLLEYGLQPGQSWQSCCRLAATISPLSLGYC
jgi:acyl carrier protein